MSTRIMLVRFNNEATTCFDRIMPYIFNPCLQSYQILPEFIALLGDLLIYAKYAIKITNTISKETYSLKEKSPVHGLGQGSTTSATSLGKTSFNGSRPSQ